MRMAGGGSKEVKAAGDGRGRDRRGMNEQIGAEISVREALEQLQATSPAADSCSGRGKDTEEEKKEAAGEAVARGRGWQQDASVPVPLRGAE